jgi:uncharacterized protein
MHNLVAFIAGSLFSLGLIISQMVNPAKVKGFLNVFGNWDPTLAFVMIGALIVASIGFKLIKAKQKPLLANEFSLPTNQLIDKPLIIGAVLFGLGWGISGLCPGPALVATATFEAHSLMFFAAMIVGMKVYELMPE